MINSIVQALEKREEVEAIMLGGSRASGKYDDSSDYDIYVYLNEPLPEIERRKILDKYCSYMEYSNHFWELEDDGKLNNGIEIELIYRSYDFFENVIKNMRDKNVGNGYSTCFYDNLMNSIILFDKRGKIEDLQLNSRGLITRDYVQVIIDKNYPLIYKSMPALLNQIKKAIERQDFNSVVHRTAEFFAIYYDILFALNKASHPGEKRLMEYALALKNVPVDFKEKTEGVFHNMIANGKKALLYLKQLSKDLEDIIVTLGYDI